MLMRINIDVLRKIIREEIERNMRWSAGMFGGVGSRTRKGNILPPQGLGSEKTEEDDKKEEKFTQAGARANRNQRKRYGVSRLHR